jgi:hypothetical protein
MIWGKANEIEEIGKIFKRMVKGQRGRGKGEGSKVKGGW